MGNTERSGNGSAGTPGLSRWPGKRWRPLAIDVAVTTVVLVILAVTVAGRDLGLPAGITVSLVLFQALPLLARRAYPLQVLAITCAAAVGIVVRDGHALMPGVAVALFTVAAGRDRAVSVPAGSAAALAIALAGALGGVATLSNVIPFTLAWLLGDNARMQRAYVQALRERAARLERENEERARRAVAEEQARIARELHDVVAHAVSVMVVQATAADDVFDAQPVQAHEAIRSVIATGRRALTELRRLVGTARTDGDRTPQPTLAQLDELVASVSATGLRVTLARDGEPRDLPAGLELGAYRVVQEALTNTLKHAHATSAAILLHYLPQELVIDVRDDGCGWRDAPATSGRGIIGMRERVALFNGTLSAGPAPNGGFEVIARLPIDREGAR